MLAKLVDAGKPDFQGRAADPGIPSNLPSMKNVGTELRDKSFRSTLAYANHKKLPAWSKIRAGDYNGQYFVVAGVGDDATQDEFDRITQRNRWFKDKKRDGYK